MMLSCAVLLLALTQHVNTEYSYKEEHKSVGVQCREFSAGYYRNSINRDSFWVAKREYLSDTKFYGELGVITGYRYKNNGNGDIMPLARLGWDARWAEFFISPGLEKIGNNPAKVIGIIGVQFKIPFGE